MTLTVVSLFHKLLVSWDFHKLQRRMAKLIQSNFNSYNASNEHNRGFMKHIFYSYLVLTMYCNVIFRRWGTQFSGNLHQKCGGVSKLMWHTYLSFVDAYLTVRSSVFSLSLSDERKADVCVVVCVCGWQQGCAELNWTKSMEICWFCLFFPLWFAFFLPSAVCAYRPCRPHECLNFSSYHWA